MNADLIYHWGTDLDVVNNARVSFDKESEWEYVCSFCKSKWPLQAVCEEGLCMFKHSLKNGDRRLIGYLARGCTQADWDEMIIELTNNGEQERIIDIVKHVKRMPEHWAPFANGVGAKFRIKAPIPIMRQVFKHKIGTVESEVSRRYVSYEPEAFYPVWRHAPEGSVKQGSGCVIHDDLDDPDSLWWQVQETYEQSVELALASYDKLLELGVCPEQARFVLPQGVYTEAIVSNSLYGWARFYNQRSDRAHAQSEIADLADQIGGVMEKRFPASWGALTK